MSTQSLVSFMFAVLVVACASATGAQSSSEYISSGPVFVTGLGGHDFGWQVSVGGEKNYDPYGIGGGVGFLYFPETNKTFDGGRASSSAPAFGVPGISLHESYYPGRQHGRRGLRLQPFVTGSILWMIVSDAPPLPGVGGGVDWWASPKRGLRCEAQYQFAWLAFRCGVVLR